MSMLIEFWNKFTGGLMQIVINPFYYLGIIFIVLQYRKQIQFERKLFHTRLHSLLAETWRTLLWGWIGGLIASILMLFIGTSLSMDTMIILWVLSFILILFRVRFFCFAYAAGLLGVLQVFLVPLLKDKVTDGFGLKLLTVLRETDVPSLIALVGVLHLLEAFLVARQGTRLSTPLFLEGKRGNVVGGYQMQNFWPVPLFLLVPFQGDSSVLLPWQPLFGGSLETGWTLLSFPVMIGFAELTVSRFPRDKTVWSAKLLALYGTAVLLTAVLAHLWGPLTIVAALLSIALHEGLVWYSRWDETQRSPIFVHERRGLKILAILPNSPAEEMGLVPGELVHKVNGIRVHTKEGLHQALRINAAFCKLEVVNLQGEIKFLHRAVFDTDHYQLGILLSPDQNAMYYVETTQVTLFAYLGSKLTGLLRNNTGKSA
ncbi:PDZ domain-containing protein [Paenibacillus larvae]|uniref:Cell division topological determinant MinJ n=1 Tax=Paenibacillus larvae subsp. larvae TaxID=147375 RepID=A0A6C0QLG8_9BACL|nr:PDZ domain-containing protein [Paenibacillus larvae]QHZ49370.1 cell division topological determinant MinJ [Paenibacillus larvae subsp. larvae]